MSVFDYKDSEGSSVCGAALEKAKQLASSPEAGDTAVFLLAGQGYCSWASAFPDPEAEADQLMALNNTNVVIHTLQFGSRFNCHNHYMFFGRGECEKVDSVDDYDSAITSVVATETTTTLLKAVELPVGNDAWIDVGMPTGNQGGRLTKTFDEDVVLVGLGRKDMRVRATGGTSEGEEGDLQVEDSVSITAIDDTPPELRCNSPETILPSDVTV